MREAPGGPGGALLLHARLSATVEAVSHALEQLEDRLAGAPLAEAHRVDVLIVAAEVLNNVAEHAYARGEADGEGAWLLDARIDGSAHPQGDWIEVEIVGDAAAVCLRICDAGRPLPDALAAVGATEGPVVVAPPPGGPAREGTACTAADRRAEPDPTALDLDALDEGGFGWPLIQQIATRVAYTRKDGKNHLLVTLDWDRG
jgi:anti-sigma regulatory factor (Ser/Thr protein kinase)